MTTWSEIQAADTEGRVTWPTCETCGSTIKAWNTEKTVRELEEVEGMFGHRLITDSTTTAAPCGHVIKGDLAVRVVVR